MYRSSSACDGCACQPSPPLSTDPPNTSAARYGAPDTPWRMTSMSAPSASIVRTVSTSDSPFDTDDEAAAMLTTSQDRFFAATSKLDAGPRGRLVEQDRHVRATERRDLGDRPCEHLAHGVRRAHHQLQLRRASARPRPADGDGARRQPAWRAARRQPAPRRQWAAGVPEDAASGRSASAVMTGWPRPARAPAAVRSPRRPHRRSPRA